MNRGLFGIVDAALKTAVSTAQATADNARQMVLNRDPRLASLDAALAAGDTVHTAINKRIDDLPKTTTTSVQIEYRDGIAVPAVLSLLGSSATVDITVTWPTAFPDSNYLPTIQCTLLDATLIGRTSAAVKSKTAAGMVVTVTTTALLAAGKCVVSAVAYRKG